MALNSQAPEAGRGNVRGGRSHAGRMGRGNLGEKKGLGEEGIFVQNGQMEGWMDGLSDSLVSREPACTRRVSSP